MAAPALPLCLVARNGLSGPRPGKTESRSSVEGVSVALSESQGGVWDSVASSLKSQLPPAPCPAQQWTGI